MDRSVLERMIGAAVLVALLVIAAPALLDGQRDEDRTTHIVDLPSGDGDSAVRTVRLKPGDTPGAAVDTPAPSQGSPEVRVGARPPVVSASDSGKSESKPRPQTSGTAPTAAPTAKGQWAIQLGSFASRQNAEQLTAQLREGGWSARMSSHKTSGRTLYRVRVDVAGDRNAATRLAGELAAAGYSGQLVAADS